MSYNVAVTDNFAREFKKLAKKYPRLKESLQTLVTELSESPAKGVYLGSGCYKIRLSTPEKARGKSGGFRIITCVVMVESTAFLLSIYDKSRLSTLKDKDISELLKHTRG